MLEKKNLFDKRFYAFEQDNKWKLILWNDEHTIMFQYGDISLVELWYSGKKLFSKQYGAIENPTLLSACLQLYDIQDSLANTGYADWSTL